MLFISQFASCATVLSDLVISIETPNRRSCHLREVSPMPAACAADLREELLARIWAPTIRAASRQDDELAAELEALEAAGGLMPPSSAELCGLPPDPHCGPPDGPDAWLVELPAELLAEYLAATQAPPRREPIVAGRPPRQQGDGSGFAAGGT